jgi:hypothetical protein
MAFGWTRPTSRLASVVRKEKSLCSPVSPLRSPVQGRQMPAKKKGGRASDSAN